MKFVWSTLAVLVSILLTVPMLAGPTSGIDLDDLIPSLSEITRNIPWNVVQDGTTIEVKEGEFANRSYYYPIPAGATVLSTNIKISALNSSGPNETYPREVIFNVGKGPEEYSFPSLVGTGFTGDWGRQYKTYDGKSYSGSINSVTGPYQMSFALPKNATVKKATINITGFQRGQEFIQTKFTGVSSGDHYGSIIKAMKSTGLTYDEILIGSPYESLEKGVVYRCYYTGTTFQTPEVFATGRSDFIHLGAAISDLFSITSLGDVVAIGAPEDTLTKDGSVFIYTYPGGSMVDIATGNLSNEAFGSSIAVGNIDMDKDPELVVGAPGANSGIGKVYILDVVASGTFSTYTNLKTVLQGPSQETHFGKSVSIGDMNGDGRGDIALSSDTKVRIIIGGAEMNADLSIDPVQDSGNPQVETSVFIGKTEGGAYHTLAAGCPTSTGGKVLLYDGGASLDSTVDQTISAPSGKTYFGSAMDGGYDFDGDLQSDYALGAPGDGSTKGWVGLYSRTSGLLRELEDGSGGNRYGASIAFGPDTRNDNYGDVIVGAPGFLGGSNLKVGYFLIHEWFDINDLPSNTPRLSIGGNRVWEYGSPHLTSTITSGDISSALNTALANALVSFSRPTDSYAIVYLTFTSLATSNTEMSATFNLTGFRITYDYSVRLPDITSAINSYIKNPNNPPSSDGYNHVPVEFTSDNPGRIRIDKFETTMDTIPSFSIPLTDLYVKEGSSNPKFLDLYTVFQDDNSGDNELKFSVSTKGVNSSKFMVGITKGRYLSFSSYNDSALMNWSGDLLITLTVLDNIEGRFITPDITVHVEPVNDAPAIKNLPDTNILQSAKFVYTATTSDAEGQTVLFSVIGPENMTVTENGFVSWQPSPWQVGDIDWSLILSDGETNRWYNFSLFVVDVNDKPIFVTPAPNQTSIYLGETFTYTFEAIDLDPDDYVYYSLTEGPPGSSIGSESGVFTWKPEVFLTGPQRFVVRAWDKESKFAELEFFITIQVRDGPPRFKSSPYLTLFDMELWSYDVEVFDPDSDLIEVVLNISPTGMVYNDITGNLTWVPNYDQVGDFNVSLRLTSTRFVLYQNFTLTVLRSARDWQLTIGNLVTGQRMSGIEKVSGEVSVEPGNVLWIEMRVDELAWVNCSYLNGVWSYELDTSRYGDGEHTISVRAFDGFRYSNTVSISVSLKNEEKKAPILLILTIPVVILLLIAAGVYIGILLHKRNLRKIEKEQKMQQLAAIEASKKDMAEFIKKTGSVDESVDYTKIDLFELQTAGKVSSHIDDLFKPLNIPKEEAEVVEELPEDILQKAKVSTSIIEIKGEPEQQMQTPPSPPRENEDQQDPPELEMVDEIASGP